MKLDLDGVLVVDKPVGPTSHDVVARARRALRTARIGHTGTLDPLASGVLPLVIGRATRLAQFLTADRKEYVADVRFGATSATYDAEGPLTPRDGPACAAGDVAAAVEAFRGTFWQTPPPHSAKKVGGTRAYTLARKHAPVDIPPVQVTVDEIELLRYDAGVARIRVVSSSGFYVRSLAHDLGQRLGCGAYLQALRRIRAGAFALDQAVALDEVEREGTAAMDRVVPLHALLPDVPAVVVTDEGLRRTTHGNILRRQDLASAASDALSATIVRILDGSGALRAVAERRPDGALHPAIVLV